MTATERGLEINGQIIPQRIGSSENKRYFDNVNEIFFEIKSSQKGYAVDLTHKEKKSEFFFEHKEGVDTYKIMCEKLSQEIGKTVNPDYTEAYICNNSSNKEDIYEAKVVWNEYSQTFRTPVENYCVAALKNGKLDFGIDAAIRDEVVNALNKKDSGSSNTTLLKTFENHINWMESRGKKDHNWSAWLLSEYLKKDEAVGQKIQSKLLTTKDFLNHTHDTRKVEIPQSENSLITKNNIGDFYNSMSFEAKQENANIIQEILSDRRVAVSKALDGVSSLELSDMGLFTASVCQTGKYLGNIIEQSYFGAKDTLKPIDECVAEIKASEQYKAYASGLEKSVSLEQSAAEHKAACGLSQEEIQASIYDTKESSVGLERK